MTKQDPIDSSRVWGDAFFKACRPRSIMTGSEWADEFRYVAPGTSPEPGEWRTSRTPYLREPLDAATDSETETMVFMASSQTGKSEWLLNVLGYYIAQEPAPQLLLQPTVEAAESFSKERIDPTIKYSDALKDLIEPESVDTTRGSSRRSSATIRMKHYPGGYLAMVGANSPAGLASRPIRILLADEIDRYGTTKEGDPLKLAIQRTTNFHNKKILFVSTPTISGRSKIESWFLKSDQRYYNVPCRHCGSLQALKWSQVKWDRGPDDSHLANTARYECEHCSGIMRGAGKPDMETLQAGRWIATVPESRIRGYHINSLYSPWVDLYKLVEEWAEVHKSRDKRGLMEFLNLKLGQPWVETEGELDYETLHSKRREYYDAEVPEGVTLLTAGVDVQDHYLACEVVGWGEGKESWGIRYAIFMGDPGQQAVWKQLETFLSGTFKRADGSELPLSATCIDSGGHFTTEVYRFTKPLEYRRIWAIKGMRGDNTPYVGKPVRNNAVGAVRFDIGVNAGKAAIMSRLNLEDEGPGYCHFPRAPDTGYDVEYFRGLLSEVLRYEYANGKSKVEWKQIYERNEPLDTRNYATAAMEILNPDFVMLRAAPVSVMMQHAPQQRGRRVLSKGVT